MHQCPPSQGEIQMERNANGSTQTASDQQNAEHFISIALGFFGSRALYVAAELGIADHLNDGPKSVAQLAATTGSHQQSLYRLLRMLAMLGVFVEKKNGEFESNALGALLRSGAMRDAAMIIGDAD